MKSAAFASYQSSGALGPQEPDDDLPGVVPTWQDTVETFSPLERAALVLIDEIEKHGYVYLYGASAHHRALLAGLHDACPEHPLCDDRAERDVGAGI